MYILARKRMLHSCSLHGRVSISEDILWIIGFNYFYVTPKECIINFLYYRKENDEVIINKF